jgi:4-amino-4-deoxy-L-arabinose transferase-like glycosyltransferase
MRLLPGLAVLVIVGVLYLIAFRKASRSKYVVAIGLILTCGLILRVYLSSDRYLHAWDERYHALVAKNLIRHPLRPTLYDDPVISYDPGNWTENHVWLHKQPVPLWSLAASMTIFGINEIALRLPSLLLSTLAVGLTFLIGQSLFSKKIGLLAAFLHSIHGMIIELTAGRIATDHIDLFFLVFVELAVYFAVVSRKRKNWSLDILTGAAMGLAILCKWLPALIVIPLWMILRLTSGKAGVLLRLTLIFFTTAIVVLPWQIYISSRYPVEAAIERLFNYRHITEVLDGHGGPFYYHFDIMRQTYGELIYLPLLWLLFKLVSAPRSRRRLFLSAWIFIPYIFFSFVKTKMQPYTIFAAPALFLLTSCFFYYVKRTAKKWRPKWLPVICLVLLVVLPVRYAMDRLMFFRYQERKPAWVEEIKHLKDILPAKSVVFNHARPIEVMFYTDLVAYQRLPSREEIDLVKQKGYAVVVVDRNGLGLSWRNDNRIILLKER